MQVVWRSRLTLVLAVGFAVLLVRDRNLGGLPIPLRLFAIMSMVLTSANAASYWLARRVVRANNEGVALSQQGRYVAAAEKFEEAVRGRPLSWYPLGSCRLALWDLERARVALDNAWRYARRQPALTTVIAPSLFLVAALRGDKEATARWAGEAKKLKTENTGVALLAAAVAAARDENWPDARRLLDRVELNLLGGCTRALRDTLRAWCAAHGAGEPWPVDQVALFGEVGSDRLRAAWPELLAFVDATAKVVPQSA